MGPLAGKPVQPALRVIVHRLVTAYFSNSPNPAAQSQRATSDTSGHYGSAFENSFNELHVLAFSQAICAYRQQ